MSKPKHYQTESGLDVIDFCKQYDLNFNLGNVVKYLARAGKKGSKIEDLEKALDYIQRELKAEHKKSGTHGLFLYSKFAEGQEADEMYKAVTNAIQSVCESQNRCARLDVTKDGQTTSKVFDPEQDIWEDVNDFKVHFDEVKPDVEATDWIEDEVIEHGRKIKKYVGEMIDKLKTVTEDMLECPEPPKQTCKRMRPTVIAEGRKSAEDTCDCPEPPKADIVIVPCDLFEKDSCEFDEEPKYIHKLTFKPNPNACEDFFAKHTRRGICCTDPGNCDPCDCQQEQPKAEKPTMLEEVLTAIRKAPETVPHELVMSPSAFSAMCDCIPSAETTPPELHHIPLLIDHTMKPDTFVVQSISSETLE